MDEKKCDRKKRVRNLDTTKLGTGFGVLSGSFSCLDFLGGI